MGRGVSYGGGQSSLGYLFGSGEAPKSTTTNAPPVQSEGPAINKEPASKPAVSAAVDATKQIPAGIQSTASRNHFGSDGQNTGNFITDRPSTKVHAAPGGGSSLGYLFGGGSN
ncbi:Protein SPIRAL1-like 1 [Capsicum baccatum]|uniref:Protein SPIRAL1-like 1 n=1 Tax=Capsicum baccatum TaxID=33114 RepID=A0A2G2VL43_CAPBA|nr:Protein SPIRAL1-like 1 [Capsicum baccatum]